MEETFARRGLAGRVITLILIMRAFKSSTKGCVSRHDHPRAKLKKRFTVFLKKRSRFGVTVALTDITDTDITDKNKFLLPKGLYVNCCKHIDMRRNTLADKMTGRALKRAEVLPGQADVAIDGLGMAITPPKVEV